MKYRTFSLLAVGFSVAAGFAENEPSAYQSNDREPSNTIVIDTDSLQLQQLSENIFQHQLQEPSQKINLMTINSDAPFIYE